MFTFVRTLTVLFSSRKAGTLLESFVLCIDHSFKLQESRLMED